MNIVLDGIASNAMKRNMLFLSHAWEDFEFTRWLALQLAQEGYGVWCDLTKLLGGENWPNEINKALKERTQKFLFILSRSSNVKENPLGELELAFSILKKHDFQNFIIPLKCDSINKNEIDFRLQNIQWIDFSENWRDGFIKLLKVLDREKVKKNLYFNPRAVNSWWNNFGCEATKINRSEEILFSNRFEIVSLPKFIYAHYVEQEPRFKGHVRTPVIPFKNYILSFNSKEELKGEQGILTPIIHSTEFDTTSLLNGTCPLFSTQLESKNYFLRLLNQSFEKFLWLNSFLDFKLSKGICYYFNKDSLENGRIIYTNNGELNNKIKLWGKYLNETWLYALRAKAYVEPLLHYMIYTHILVNGEKGLRAAPKMVTKRWTNDKWRDKLRASMLHIAKGQNIIEILKTNNESLTIKTSSVIFNSPISYIEPMEDAGIDTDD